MVMFAILLLPIIPSGEGPAKLALEKALLILMPGIPLSSLHVSKWARPI